MNDFGVLWSFLDEAFKAKSWRLVLLMFTVSLVDALGVFSIFPFLTVVSNPDAISSNAFLSFLVDYLSFTDNSSFMIFLGMCSMVLITTSLALKAFSVVHQNKYALGLECWLSSRLLNILLNQTYSSLIRLNSNDIGRKVLSEVSNLISYGVNPSVLIIANTLNLIALLCVLLFVETVVTLILIATFSAFYIFVFSTVTRLIKSLGVSRYAANQKRYEIVGEAFRGIKETKFYGLERKIFENYFSWAKVYADALARSNAIYQTPRYLLEFLGFSILILIIVVGLHQGNSVLTQLPLISLIAFAGYRALPAAQMVYLSAAQIKFVEPSIRYIERELSRNPDHGSDDWNDNPDNPYEKIQFKKCIKIKSDEFRYLESKELVLKSIDVEIKKGKITALVGPSGSGKTTIVDILLGLIKPFEGSITVDGKSVAEFSKKQWLNFISYVPQQIFLIDGSVEQNITFGENKEGIDKSRVKSASKAAALHDFITTKMPDGFETQIGENGVRLSGGQRQRLGLARSLYRQSQLLVLDEATSALDSKTEALVLKKLKQLTPNTTVIMITHNKAVIESADVVYEFSKGIIKLRK